MPSVPERSRVHTFRVRAKPETTSAHFVGVATLSGLEPELSGPKPLVLPLHHRVIKTAKTVAFYFTTHVAHLEFPRETSIILRCAGKAGNTFHTK